MTASAGNKGAAPASGRPPGTGHTVVVLDSRQLFADRDEILIRHENETYRLRLTRQNKLILTK